MSAENSPAAPPLPLPNNSSLNSAEDFRQLVEASTIYAMFLIDTEGRITSWNEGARRLFGYDDAEIIGQPAALIFTDDDKASGVPEREMATAAREVRASDVRWHQRKDKTRFWADGVMERLSDASGTITGFAKVLRDATIEKENTERITESEARFRTLFDAVDVGFCIIEMLFDSEKRPYDYRFLEVNPAFERHTGLVNGVGKTALELVPNLDDFWFRTYGQVALTGEAVRFENHAPAMGRWFDVYALRVGPAEDCKVGLLFTDITARKEAQTALQSSEEQLRDAQTRLEVALSAGEIGTWIFDVVNNRVVADANLARLFSVDAQAAAGGELDIYLEAIHEDDRARVTEIIGESIAHKNDYAADYRAVFPDGSYRWLTSRGKVERNADGITVALPGVVVDITERVERERRERFLADLTAQARALLDPEAVLYETAKAVGEYTGAHRALYIEVDDEADTLTIRRDYVREEDGIPSIAGTLPMSAFGHSIISSLRAGRVTQVSDTEADPSLTPENRAMFRATHFRSFLAVPFQRDGRFVAILALHYAQPRVWTSEEADLLSAVVERTWLALENALLFRETQQQAEREALLNQISTAVRTAAQEPEALLRAAVSLLGQGLKTDRCYFVRYDQDRDTAQVLPEWIREGMEGVMPLVGQTFQMSVYSVDREPTFKAGSTHIVNDVVDYDPADAAPLLALPIRSLLRVPIEAGNQMTALTVAMAFTPRKWTDDEVRLVENVAALLRSVLETASLQQRERNISQQLQNALVPPSPNNLIGLALASYYRPALAEASVGGDFFDVFPVEKGCTALVVADLSGKGLAAASQVATVRNMLRFSLYTGKTVSQAVTLLHDALVEHDLLTGFATLFVGMYDQNEHTLTYVNCGQEPGLLWRRSAPTEIEALVPTGPVLGGFAFGAFEQRIVPLAEGDVLALFTDGLTEVGPNRKELLGVNGVSALLGECCSNGKLPNTPQAVVEGLIAGIEGFAHDGMRDDIALLVGVAGQMDVSTGA